MSSTDLPPADLPPAEPAAARPPAWMSRLWVHLTLVNVLALLLVSATLVGLSLYRAGVVLARLPGDSFLEVQQLLRANFWYGLMALLHEVAGQVVWTLVAALLLAVASALALSAAYARYLAPLLQATRRLATGDFRVRVNETARIQELRRLEQDLNRTAARLEHLEHERQFESAAIAHELRTPLTALRLRVQGLQDGVLPLSPAELAPLLIQLGHLGQLADALTTLTLADAGQLPLEVGPVDARALLQQLDELFQGAAQAGRLTLTIHDPGDVTFRGDPHQLRKVLSNIVENALKYTPPGGRVEVGTRVTAAAIEFVVVDTGPGVPPETLGQLVHRFYRTEASRTRAHGGSGLGLAIADVIVRAHGGTLTAAAGPQGGLELRVRLPLLATPDSSFSPAAPSVHLD